MPLPPDAAEPTLPLRIVIAHAVWQRIVGDHHSDGWREIAAVFPAEQLHTMLPDAQPAR